MEATTTTTTTIASTTTKTTTRRLFAAQEPGWQRFIPTGLVSSSSSSGTVAVAASQLHHTYNRQYAHVYHQRLAILGRLLSPSSSSPNDSSSNNSNTTSDTRAADDGGTIVPQFVRRILELPEDCLVSCVGTFVREGSSDSKKKDDYAYFLEDESGRVALSLDSIVASATTSTTTTNDNKSASSNNQTSSSSTLPLLCTGVVLRITGIVKMDGIFYVQEIATVAQVQVLPPRPRDTTNAAAATPHLLLLSGLECGSPHASSLPRDMLISYLEGVFRHDKAAAIVHVIVAGGLVTASPSSMVDGCRDLDGFITSLTQTLGIPVTVLPGKHDPTTAQWPQRPLHTSLLPHSSRSRLCTRSPNPYASTFTVEQKNTADHDGIGGGGTTTTMSDSRRRFVLGTDGTNVTDFVQQQQTHASELDALRQTLAHQHICPSGPDSVPTAPHTENDPMVIASFAQQPSIYFCGNATQFDTELVSIQLPPTSDSATTTCRLVCIPKFIDSSIAVLVNLESLDVELLKFDGASVE